MTFTTENTFFDVKRRDGLLFIELRTRANDRLLTPEEAMTIAEIPEGMTLCSNPDTPGRAAFKSQTLMGMRLATSMSDAGFRYNADDVAKTKARELEQEQQKVADAAMTAQTEALMAEVRKRLQDEMPGQKIASIQPHGDGMVIVTMNDIEGEQEARELETFAKMEKVRFNVDTRPEKERDGTIEDVVRVSIQTFLDGEWCGLDGEEFSDMPEFLIQDASDLCMSLRSAEATILALQQIGWEYEPRLFVFYKPHQLAFGFHGDAEDWNIFLFPIEAECDFLGDLLPYEDDLRGDALHTEPSLFKSNLLENTWEVEDGMTRDQVTSAMQQLGYTYDRELDEIH